MGNYELAIADYSKTLEINPNMPQVYYNRSLAYYEKKAYTFALQDALQAKSMGLNVDSKYIDWLKTAVRK